jgi:hypothetical protein
VLAASAPSVEHRKGAAKPENLTSQSACKIFALAQQLPKHKRQDASVSVVVHLDGRINAKLDRLIGDGAVLACNAQSDILTWRDLIGEPEHVDSSGFGLIATGRIPKTSFNAFKILQRRGRDALPRVRCWRGWTRLRRTVALERA